MTHSINNQLLSCVVLRLFSCSSSGLTIRFGLRGCCIDTRASVGCTSAGSRAPAVGTPSASSPSAILSRPQVRRVAPPAPEPDILPDEVIEPVHPPGDTPAVLPCTDRSVELELNGDVLETLGDDPTKKPRIFGKDIQKDLAVRLQHIATNGLSKDLRKELREKYPVPANCSLIDAPQINPEVKSCYFRNNF